MKRSIAVTALALSLTFAGCSGSQYLADRPYVIAIQSPAAAGTTSIQDQSLQALLDAFADYHWEIHGLDRANHRVTAEACRRGEDCAEVVATVKEDGTVEIARSPGRELSSDAGELLRRWLANIKKAHQKHMRSN